HGRRSLAWLRRRTTSAGAFVLVGWMLALSASDPEQTLALQMFVVLTGLIAIALVMTLFFRLPFSLERHPPRFATAGEVFSLRVRLTNLSAKAQRGLEYFEELRDPPVTLAEFDARLRPGRANRSFRLSDSLPPIRMAQTRPEALPSLPPKGTVEVTVRVLPHRRGPLVLTGGLVARRDPFGLFRAFSRVRKPHTVLVLPRRYPLPPLALPGRTQYQRGGVAMAAGVGESEEFISLREYRQGDSLRRIHWRSTARRGEPIVKEFQDEHFTRHALVLDTFCEAAHDALFEEAVAVAASFACTIPDQDSLLDLMFVGPDTVCVTTGRGVGHAQQMLEVLAAVRPCRENRVGDLRTLVLNHVERLSGVLLVCLEWDDGRRDLARRLRALNVPTLAMVLVRPGRVTPFDPGPPDAQPDRLLLLESGRVGSGWRQLEAAA
ncbi:MAG: DUF58 domain-containing protein, partial [Verrucomicrobiae bacterium]|nr:DUF58 domain-containing protein [Verrucomicrobiae bacterium]